MKRGSTIFLQGVLVVLGLGALALLVWEPQLEGVNANASNFEIYFKDPFIALVYMGAVPFFVALYQAFRLLGYIGQNEVFSEPSVKALRTIKYCALAIIGFVLAEELFIFLNHGNDDVAGGVFIGGMIAFVSIVIATAAALFERMLQSAVEIKSENDFTV